MFATTLDERRLTSERELVDIKSVLHDDGIQPASKLSANFTFYADGDESQRLVQGERASAL